MITVGKQRPSRLQILLFLFTYTVEVCVSVSQSCANFQVVPGSLFDFAYRSTSYFAARDLSYCGSSVHPNATLPIFRDTRTGPFIAQEFGAWFWVGLYQNDTSLQNNSGFVWIDKVSAVVRNPVWALYNPEAGK
jgi:hypothetical protein